MTARQARLEITGLHGRRMVAAGWPRHLAALGLLAVAILSLYAKDVMGMAAIWWTSSTYGHILFIPLLIGWLVHQRMPILRQIAPRVSIPGLVWMAMGSLLWLLGDAASLAVLRHAAIIVMIQGAVAASLGFQTTRVLIFPLFYAFFMVPVGSELEPALQILTARIAMTLLGGVGVPAHMEDIFITIPGGLFKVAEACSGARFLIAMTAYAVLVCHVCFRSWTRRAIFLIFALVTCVIANGIRAFSIIYAAYLTSIDIAVGFDHVIYGWLFFALVMALVMAAAWPFFDRAANDPFPMPAMTKPATESRLPLSTMCAAALLILIAAPSWSLASAMKSEAQLQPPYPPEVAGWLRITSTPAQPWKPHFEGADHLVMARYVNQEGAVVDLAIATYRLQGEGRELIGFGQGAAPPDSAWVWASPAWAPSGGKGEAIAAPGPVNRHVASFYRVGKAHLTGSAAQIKFDTMAARLLMRDQRAVAILVSAEDSEVRPADRAISAFVRDLGDLEDLADAATRTR